LIQETLNKIAEEITTVTIAHRIKTIMNCQEIFVFENGKIAESGKFSDLQRYKDVEI
jgi:ABC-type transport system involved in Fe-S cluster assembly fused permease/ATPase subunit